MVLSFASHLIYSTKRDNYYIPLRWLRLRFHVNSSFSIRQAYQRRSAVRKRKRKSKGNHKTIYLTR